MQCWKYGFLFFCTIVLVLCQMVLTVSTDIPDFEFESELLPDYNYPDDEMKSVEQMVLNDMAEDEPTSFTEKEKQIRDALARSTQDVRNRRTISQVMPILRSISKQQRLALAALITAQTSARSGNELNLKQVEEMFGERQNLILPVIFDIANIVKDISQDKKNDSATLNSSEKRAAKHFDGRIRRSVRFPDNERKSYHERKLNMTDFRGTRESNDQQAIESETQIHVTLPNKNLTSATTTKKALSLEEIENLAFHELNGTNGSTDNGNSYSNTTNSENLPEPEMLIRPYRVRPRPIAERFDNIYLYVADYPINQIMGSIRRHRHAMTALLADNPSEWKAHLEEIEAKKRRGDEDENASPTSGMCPSIVRYARPQKARSASGDWKYIVNTGQHTQTLRLEKCTSPEQTCTYLTDNFSSRCSQVYNYHRLLSWDNKRGLHIDIFKVPTCCSCHIDGYREKFPPVAEQNQELYSDTRYSSNDPLYSLTANDYNDNDDSSSAFTPIVSNSKKHRFEKRKKLKRPEISNLETFLTPPTHNEYIGTDSFKRKQSITSVNRPINRKKNAEPVLIGGDDLSETVLTPIMDRAHMQQPHSPIVTSNLAHKNIQIPRLAPSKVLIKRVNYNYHPIIDFFFRDRALKTGKIKDNRIGHSTALL